MKAITVLSCAAGGGHDGIVHGDRRKHRDAVTAATGGTAGGGQRPALHRNRAAVYIETCRSMVSVDVAADGGDAAALLGE